MNEWTKNDKTLFLRTETEGRPSGNSFGMSNVRKTCVLTDEVLQIRAKYKVREIWLNTRYKDMLD